MKGRTVKKALKDSRFTQDKVAVIIGKDRTNVSKILADDKDVPQWIIDKLKKSGVAIPENVQESEDDGGPSEELTIRALKLLAEHKDQLIEVMKDNISSKDRGMIGLEKAQATIDYGHRELVDVNKTFRRIVDMCLDAGVVITDPTAAKRVKISSL